MFIQHIELVGRRLLECLAVITIRCEPTQQLSASACFFRTLLGSWTVVASFNRPIPHRRATTTAGIHRGAHHEPFSLQHSQMITRGIDMHIGFGGKTLQRLSWMPLDSMEKAYPGFLCEAPEIFNSARHKHIVSSRHVMTTATLQPTNDRDAFAERSGHRT